jgi:murein DD-endopeptidase MepM/ murein hydrolase activator NlpD
LCQTTPDREEIRSNGSRIGPNAFTVTFVKLRTACAITVLIIGAMLPGGAAWADPHEDKARVDRELAEAQASLEAATDRAKQAGADLAAANAALPGAEAALADANGKVIGADAAVRQADRDAATAKAVEGEKIVEFNRARDAVDQGRAEVASFVNAAYRGGGLMELNALLNAQNPSEVAQRLGYLDQVSAHQERVLDRLTVTRMAAKQANDAAQLARKRAEDAAAAARKARTDAIAARNNAAAAADRVRALVQQRTRSAAIAESERAASLALYEELKAESARIEAELRAAAGRGGGGVINPPGNGAILAMPVRGFKSSNFGNRFHPIYNEWRFHSGVDFAAAGGTTIVASADGRIVRAGWNGGYGQYTCIYHGTYQGKGLGTCYAHQSQILVGNGQQVRRGQMIGRVGTTGSSTGNHLHFEVRLNGTPVQPLNYLPSCLC